MCTIVGIDGILTLPSPNKHLFITLRVIKGLLTNPSYIYQIIVNIEDKPKPIISVNIYHDINPPVCEQETIMLDFAKLLKDARNEDGNYEGIIDLRYCFKQEQNIMMSVENNNKTEMNCWNQFCANETKPNEIWCSECLNIRPTTPSLNDNYYSDDEYGYMHFLNDDPNKEEEIKDYKDKGKEKVIIPEMANNDYQEEKQYSLDEKIATNLQNYYNIQQELQLETIQKETAISDMKQALTKIGNGESSSEDINKTYELCYNPLSKKCQKCYRWIDNNYKLIVKNKEEEEYYHFKCYNNTNNMEYQCMGCYRFFIDKNQFESHDCKKPKCENCDLDIKENSELLRVLRDNDEEFYFHEKCFEIQERSITNESLIQYICYICKHPINVLELFKETNGLNYHHNCIHMSQGCDCVKCSECFRFIGKNKLSFHQKSDCKRYA